MKKLSDTYKELGIAFAFPIKIKDADGNVTYFESVGGFWHKKEYDSNGNKTYFENSQGWLKREYNSNGKETYFEDSHGNKREYNSNGKETYHEDSNGNKRGTPRNKTCDGKVVEIDGIKYELKLKN